MSVSQSALFGCVQAKFLSQNESELRAAGAFIHRTATSCEHKQDGFVAASLSLVSKILKKNQKFHF